MKYSAAGVAITYDIKKTSSADKSGLIPTTGLLSSLPATSLAFALDGAAQAIEAVRSGRALPAVLTALFRTVKEPAARGAIQDIAYRTLRALGSADALVALLSTKPPAPHVANVLACAFALLVEPEESAAYAPFTIVDQAVRAIGTRHEVSYAKGFVNAILRNFLRTRSSCLEKMRRDPVALWNYPRWWIEAVKSAWPDAWQSILTAGNTPPPMTLRVNRRHLTVAEYLNQLKEAAISAYATSASAVQLASPMPVEQLPGFAQGLVSVQDEGAQRAAFLLNVENGMRVLDACAAPGGKTGHLLELADLDLVALEENPARAARINENLKRLQLNATVDIGDAGAPDKWWDGRPFDRVLADVPCSASGIVRRHPDIRWLKRPTDLNALVLEQRRILAGLWTLVKPGGQLLYVTCSIFPQENEQQAQWFVSSHQAQRLEAPGQLLPALATSNDGLQTDHDGFFYALFRKP